MRSGLLGLAIGLALADSSIVTLALPEILSQFDVGVDDRRLGAHVVQPRARTPRGARRVPRPAAASQGVRVGSDRVRSVVPGLRPRAVLRGARRGTLVPGCGRSLRRRGRPRPSLRDDWERGSGGPLLGGCRRARRRPRSCGGRGPDRDARLGVDLPRPGATRHSSRWLRSEACLRDRCVRRRGGRI